MIIWKPKEARRGSEIGGCTDEGGVTVRAGDGGTDDNGEDMTDEASGIRRWSSLITSDFTGVFRDRRCGSPVSGSGELETLSSLRRLYAT
jgi:hypothetical protein